MAQLFYYKKVNIIDDNEKTEYNYVIKNLIGGLKNEKSRIYNIFK